MPSFNTDIYTGQASLNVKDRVDGTKVTGDRRQFQAIYTTTGTEAAADTINIVQLPIGATLLVETLRITSEGIGGTGATIATIGDSTSAGRYSATAVALTAAGTLLSVTGVNANEIAPYAVTSATNVITGTLALSSGSITAAKKVVIRGQYLMP
jgi:hypothetical protein